MVITTNRPFWFWCPTQEAMFRNRFELFRFKFDATMPFFCRSRSDCCECRSCLFSRGGEISSSSGTTSRMQTGEQPTQSVAAGHGATASTVGARSMSGTGKYLRKSATGRRRRESSASREPRSSSSTTVSNVDRSDTSYGSSSADDRVHGTGSSYEQHVGRDDRSGGSDRDDNRRATRTDRSGHENIGGNTAQDKNIRDVVPMGATISVQHEMEDAVQAKKSRVDRPLVTMKVPTRQNWESYLSYLYHIYEKEPKIDLTCYESLSDPDDE